jgi:hypothetical protein
MRKQLKLLSNLRGEDKSRYIILLMSLLFLPFFLYGQLSNQGAYVKLLPGAKMIVLQDLDNDLNGTIENEGLIHTGGDMLNLDGLMKGSGQYEVEGDFLNQDDFQADNSTFIFLGSNSMILSGGDPLYQLHLDQDPGQSLVLLDELSLQDELQFGTADQFLQLGDYHLILGASAGINGADDTHYLITSGSGRVYKQSLSAFYFPVGYDASTYNPVEVVEKASGGNIGVRCLEYALDQGLTGSPNMGVVFASWEIQPDQPALSNLDITVEWAGTDEPASFDRTESGIYYYDGTAWDIDASDLGPAAGGDPYTQTLDGITAFGVFAVGDGCIFVDSLQLTQDPLPSDVYRADDYLVSDDVILPGSDVTFIGGSEIGLIANFHARPGSDFWAYIEACAVPPADPATEPFVEENPEEEEEVLEESAVAETSSFRVMPNPFRDRTTLEYNLLQDARVSLIVLDGRGSLVKMILRETEQAQGLYRVDLDARLLDSGLYIALLGIDGHWESLKMVKVER